MSIEILSAELMGTANYQVKVLFPMIGLITAIVVFNWAGFRLNRLNVNQTLHIWTFTMAFQVVFDTIIEFKYFGYWYFSKEVDWAGLIPHTILIPPVNMLFLSFFPFRQGRGKQLVYILGWTIGILIYEMITLLPEPWGYFHYGWWSWWHSAILDPVLFLLLIAYHKWILTIEKAK